MKKVYNKPLISVEALTLDQPIAVNCTADYDDIAAMMEFGYFTEKRQCTIRLLPTEGFDYDGDGTPDTAHDTICYHSNVQTAFLS